MAIGAKPSPLRSELHLQLGLSRRFQRVQAEEFSLNLAGRMLM